MTHLVVYSYGYLEVPRGVAVAAAGPLARVAARGPASVHVGAPLLYVRARSLDGDQVEIRVGVFSVRGREPAWANPLLLPAALAAAQELEKLLPP